MLLRKFDIFLEQILLSDSLKDCMVKLLIIIIVIKLVNYYEKSLK